MLCFREQVVPGGISLRPPLGGMENHFTAVWENRARLERVSDASGRGSGMAAPRMSKATAIWLVENTALTFDQIGDFCDLSLDEVQAIADGEVPEMTGLDPVANGQTTKEEIARWQADSAARLNLAS